MNRNLLSRRAIPPVLACWLILAASSAAALEIPRQDSTVADHLRQHVRYLASDETAGRAVGAPGIALARDYIAGQFARYGLRPGGDNGGYLQSFDVVAGVKVIQPTRLSLGSTALALNEDWVPLGLSASGKTAGDVIFAGYGITAKDYGYDDYDGIDANGKIVLVLRYEPPPKDDKSPFRKAPRFSSHASLYAKANNARAHGAVAMILIDVQPDGRAATELIPPDRSLSRGNTIIAAQLKGGVLEKWLEPHGLTLAKLKQKIDDTGRPASMPIPGARADIVVSLEENRVSTENVVGFIPGADPSIRPEHVIVGAHYDHLGYGHYGTPDSSTAGQVHYGADDNASGIAVLLNVAERLSRATSQPGRTVVFVAFSGEELGLHGSRHYTRQPPFPLSSATAMLNLDMVGRLKNDRLTVFGARSANHLSEMITAEARDLGLEIRESDNVGRSDNVSFYAQRVPAVHFFSGTHADYHRPSDTWEKLNYEGMSRIADLVLRTASRLANTPEAIKFVALPTRPVRPEAGEAALVPAYFGSIPDYDGGDEGVRLAGVSPGSPAAIAGLREGDIIIRFAGARIQNIEDFMTQLSAQKPGDHVEIVVLRSGAPVTAKATLARRG